MAHEILKKYLQAIHPVEDDILDTYLSHWQAVSYPKKHIMTHEGQVQKHIYFVLEGIQKSYYVYDGKVHVIAFTYPPSFTGIPESFFTQTPAKYFLETITESRFIRISFENHQKTMLKYRSIETLYRKLTELVLIGIMDRYYELMAYDIETRFRSFATRSPHLLNQIPHKDLASYLRINSTNFSKLWNKVQV